MCTKHSFYLALQIDSSAAFDRRKPSRGFRRWKALPEIKETVLSITENIFVLNEYFHTQFQHELYLFLHKITLFLH
jgi:hypothetical protein